MSSASALHMGGERELSPTLSYLLGTVVHSCNFLRLSRPREERGLVTGGVVSEGILCILLPMEEVAPAVLVILTVCLEVVPKFLDLTGGQAHSDS